MAVTADDVRLVADLARLGIADADVPRLVRELNGILAHVAALQQVDIEGVEPAAGVSSGGMPLRDDGGDQYPMAYPVEAIAPAGRDGFVLVPRLATHAAGAADETPLLAGAVEAPDTGAAFEPELG